MAKVLTDLEAEQLIFYLQNKFKPFADKVEEMIRQDIKNLGFISLSTSEAQKNLVNLILKEKQNYEN